MVTTEALLRSCATHFGRRQAHAIRLLMSRDHSCRIRAGIRSSSCSSPHPQENPLTGPTAPHLQRIIYRTSIVGINRGDGVNVGFHCMNV